MLDMKKSGSDSRSSSLIYDFSRFFARLLYPTILFNEPLPWSHSDSKCMQTNQRAQNLQGPYFVLIQGGVPIPGTDSD